MERNIKSWWRRHDGHPRARAVVLGALIVTLLGSPFAVAATGDRLRLGKRNTASKETSIMSNVRETGGRSGGYATRQSNTSNSGGGAIYGCRARTGSGNNPCIRANNLATGKAFEFSFGGVLGGTIDSRQGGDKTKPFTTNATGVADGLNADRVDGAQADQLKTRWLLINEAGQIEAQSGGFTVLDSYKTNANVYIDAGTNMSQKGITATIAVQNKIDQTRDGQPDPSFGGQVAVGACQTASVECVPGNAKTPNAFVVAPRQSDGGTTEPNSRKRVYVTVTE